MGSRKAPTVLWLVPVIAIVVLSYLVPYAFLSDVDEWYGSMLFWTASTAVVIVINAVVSSAWRD